MSDFKITANVDEVLKVASNLQRLEIASHVRYVFFHTGRRATNFMRLAMKTTPKTGRRYDRRKNASKIHVASSAGNAPAIDGGGLIGSLFFKTGKFELVLGANKEYAYKLEDPNQLNRPFLLPALNAHRERASKEIMDRVAGYMF